MKESMKEILKKIIDSADIDDNAMLTDMGEQIPLSKDNFFPITKEKFQNRFKKMAFVDGGNLEIIKSPSLSLFFNRVYCTLYLEKRIGSWLFEFYTLIKAINKGNIVFSAETFFTKGKLDIPVLEFDSFDNTFSMGKKRGKISAIGDIVRRFAELVAASKIDKDVIVVLDGSLESSYTHESMFLETLKEKNCCGVSKTNSFLTKKGNSLNAWLEKNAPYNSWYYLLKKDTFSIFFAKLNEKSEYILRIDTNSSPDIFFLLAKNSQDLIFPGYPYGLIEADRFARVSLSEQETLKLQLKVLMKQDFKKIKPLVNSLNAHSVLDSIG